jgi:hypothetical protein
VEPEAKQTMLEGGSGKERRVGVARSPVDSFKDKPWCHPRRRVGCRERGRYSVRQVTRTLDAGSFTGGTVIDFFPVSRGPEKKFPRGKKLNSHYQTKDGSNKRKLKFFFIRA